MGQQPVRIVVVMEGGLLSGIYTLGVPVEAITIDYDTEGSSDRLHPINQGSYVAQACVNHVDAGNLDKHVMESIQGLWPE